MLDTTNKCTKCNHIKSLSEFHKDCTTKNGYKSQCKECTKLRSAEYYNINKGQFSKYYEENKERKLKRQREYYLENKTEICNRRKEYDLTNKDKISDRKKLYYIENKDRISSECKKYRDNNKYKTSITKRNYYIKNKKMILDRQSSRRKTDEGRARASRYDGIRRYLKKIASDGTIPTVMAYPLTDELHKLLIYQDKKCYICSCDISIHKHLDHWIPLSKGGLHSISNVVWLCPRCNLTKSNKMPDTLLIV